MRFSEKEAIDLFGKNAVVTDRWQILSAILLIFFGFFCALLATFSRSFIYFYLIAALVTSIGSLLAAKNFTLILKKQKFNITKVKETERSYALYFKNPAGIEKKLITKKPAKIVDGDRNKAPFFTVSSFRLSKEKPDIHIEIEGGKKAFQDFIQPD